VVLPLVVNFAEAAVDTSVVGVGGNPLVVTWMLVYKPEAFPTGKLLGMRGSSLLFHTASETSE
jgi:hypothetical protein